MRPQLAVEAVFLEASDRLVGSDTSGLSERQADALERLAFDWILNAEKYVEPKFTELTRAREKARPPVLKADGSIVSSKGAEHGPRSAQVVQLCGVLLGDLSSTRLAPISARFFQVHVALALVLKWPLRAGVADQRCGGQELEARLRVDASVARQELLQLCEGMRWLRLPVSTDAEARLVSCNLHSCFYL